MCISLDFMLYGAQVGSLGFDREYCLQGRFKACPPQGCVCFAEGYVGVVGVKERIEVRLSASFLRRGVRT